MLAGYEYTPWRVHDGWMEKWLVPVKVPLAPVVRKECSNRYSCLYVEDPTVDYEPPVEVSSYTKRPTFSFAESDDDFLNRIWVEAISLPATRIPKSVSFKLSPPPIKGFCPVALPPTVRLTVEPLMVGGDNNCWASLLDLALYCSFEPREGMMSMSEFKLMMTELLEDGDYWSSTAFDYAFTFVQQSDLVWHFAYGSVGLTLKELHDLVHSLPDDKLVGKRLDKSDVEAVGAQLPDLIDISLEPVAFATSKSLLEKAVKWYASRVVSHEPINWTPGLPIPPGYIPTPPLPIPTVPNDGLEHMPQIIQFNVIEWVRHALEWLNESGNEFFNDAYKRLVSLLASYGINITVDVQFWVLRFKDFVQQLSVSSLAIAKEVFNNFGFSKLIDAAVDTLQFLTGFLTDLFHAAYNVLDYGILGLKVFAFLMQDFTEYHGADVVFRRAIASGALNFPEETIQLLGTGVGSGIRTMRTKLNQRITDLNHQGHALSGTNAVETNALTVLAAETTAIARNVGTLPDLILAEDTDEDIVKDFQCQFPNYNVTAGINSHPHANLAAIRTAFRNTANTFLAARNRPVRAVGASVTEMPAINRCLVNDWPTLSGRDEYRKKAFNTPANAAFRQLTHSHRFEDCDCKVRDAAGNVTGTTEGFDIWAFFSTHDISPKTFIETMAKSSSDTAVVAMHLPFPLLDRRVTSYRDAATNILYEVEGDKLHVYHLGGQSAGYSHDFETVYSWMHNLPVFDNAHVQLEVLSQLGTAVLFALTIGKGSQEVVPSIWNCQREEFYILPELLHRDLADSTKKHFAVTARKFEQLTAFVAMLDPEERQPKTVVSKLRGMLAEIRVGITKVEARWSVTLPQLYSLIQHAVIAHELYAVSTTKSASKLRSYYNRQAWRYGNFAKRWVQGRIDLVCFNAGGEADPLSSGDTFFWLTSNRYNHKNTYNPYHRAGEYRKVNTTVRRSNDVAPVQAILCTTGSTTLHVAKAPFKLIEWVYGKTRGMPFPRKQFARERGTHSSPPESAHVWVEHRLSSHFVFDDDFEENDQSGEPAGTRDFDSLYDVSTDGESETKAGPSEPPKGNEHGKPMERPLPPTVPERPRTPQPSKLSEASSSVSSRPPTPEVTAGQWGETFVDSDDEVVDDVTEAEPLPEPLEGQTISLDQWLEVGSKTRDLYEVQDAFVSECKPRVMDFSGPLLPVVVQHPADETFSKMIGARTAWVWPSEPTQVPCPSSGACHLIKAAMDDRQVRDFPQTFLPELTMKAKHIRLRLGQNALPEEMDDKSKALERKMEKFIAALQQSTGNSRLKVLTIEGPPMCAKSSLVREFVEEHTKATLVYVPSNDLADDWKRKVKNGALFNVMTRQTVPPRGSYSLGVIDEVFNFETDEIYFHLRLMASRGVKLVILLGDKMQKQLVNFDINHAYLNHRINMHTSLGMPRDAHFALCQKNNLDQTFYTTTGSIAKSIFLTTSPENLPKADLRFQMHPHSSSRGLSTIGKIQGVRAEVAVFYADETNMVRGAWLNTNPSRYTVAVTRHSRALIVCAAPSTSLQWFQNTQPLNIVGASSRPQLDKTLSPRVVDDLIAPVKNPRLASLITKLRASLESPLALDGHFVTLEQRETEPTERMAKGRAQREDLQALIHENVNFSLPEPSELDLITSQPLRPLRFQDPGPKAVRNDVRNDLRDAHLLADIQVNSSGFDNLKNLIDRQIATTKSSSFGTPDMIEGRKIAQRYRECFYSKDALLLTVDKDISWLIETETNALNMIANSEPLGETARTLQVNAEYKTQTKAKAVPSFAATAPYGQSILANTKQFNAKFANVQPLLYGNMKKMLRPGVILDYGMSDDDLSRELVKLGQAQDMNGPNNIQADVSKQDSSHTAALAYAFFLLARDTGADQEIMEFYLAYIRRYQFLSRGVDACRSSVSFNLGSGDPFTLLRNDIMELCVIACRYHHASTMVIVEKGDDVHGVISSLAAHSYASLPSIAKVKLTVDFGTVGYHAGRFHTGKRYVVDPVRAFYKHFTRLADTNVTNAVLYSSYVSRATDYSDEEVEFLIPACIVHYPYLSSTSVCTMISTMIDLRRRSVFEQYSKIPVKPFFITVDTQSGCIVNCVRAVRPGRQNSFYRQFKGQRPDYLKALLDMNNIPWVDFKPMMEEPVGVILLESNHARVRVSLSGEHPVGTFKIRNKPNAI